MAFSKDESNLIETNFNNATKEIVMDLGAPDDKKPYKINIRERYQVMVNDSTKFRAIKRGDEPDPIFLFK